MEIVFPNYLAELLTVTSITLLTVITPGPDFVIVARNSLSYSRRSGIFTAAGVSVAVWIHVLYTLAGIGIILSKSIILFSIAKLLGAGYLLYLGIFCLMSDGKIKNTEYSPDKGTVSDAQSFKMGFINNALNPKATLFFLSLFTQVVSTTTPLAIQVLYGSIVSFSCLSWFSVVAFVLNRKGIKNVFLKFQLYIEKFMGVVLITFGIKVALSTTK